VRAYEQALRFDDFYELHDPAIAEEYLRRWVTKAKASELEPLVKFAEMIEAHWDRVLRWHRTRISNGLLEGLNSLVQAASAELAGTAQGHVGRSGVTLGPQRAGSRA
jgi:transposase